MRLKNKIIGKIKSPEDFIVREVIDKKFLRRFIRTCNGVERTKGSYLLLLLKKKNITTPEAIKLVAKKLGIRENEIGYAGLKDKLAITQQYITIKRDKINEEKLDEMKHIIGIELKKVGYTDKKISVGDLISNEFEITLHSVREAQKDIEKNINNILKNGMLNYFGQQRFGKYENNHIIGKCLVKKEFNKALKIINENCKNKFSDINAVPKKMLKFFVHAYQSFLFNGTLRTYMNENTAPYFHDIPVFGYNTKMGNNKFDKIIKNIIKNEKIRQKDFMISELRICCNGGKRNAFIKLNDINYEIDENKIKLRFALPKGSYATVLLNEIGA